MECRWENGVSLVNTALAAPGWDRGQRMGIILLVAIGSVPPEMLRATVVDGTNRWCSRLVPDHGPGPSPPRSRSAADRRPIQAIRPESGTPSPVATRLGLCASRTIRRSLHWRPGCGFAARSQEMSCCCWMPVGCGLEQRGRKIRREDPGRGGRPLTENGRPPHSTPHDRLSCAPRSPTREHLSLHSVELQSIRPRTRSPAHCPCLSTIHRCRNQTCVIQIPHRLRQIVCAKVDRRFSLVGSTLLFVCRAAYRTSAPVSIFLAPPTTFSHSIYPAITTFDRLPSSFAKQPHNQTAIPKMGLLEVRDASISRPVPSLMRLVKTNIA